MRIKLTEANVSKLKPKSKGYWVSDTALKGLRLYVGAETKTYYLNYRNQAGVSHSLKIGDASIITSTDARATAQKLLAEMVTKGTDIQQERKEMRSAPTLADMIDAYESSGRSKFNADMCRRFPFCEKRITEITRLMVEQWRVKERQATGVKFATINRRINTLKSVLNFAVQCGVLERSPLEKFGELKTVDSDTKIRYLTDDERKRLMEALDRRDKHKLETLQRGYKAALRRNPNTPNPMKWTYGSYMKPLILLALNTGMRRGALFSLRWEDVDFERGVIYLRADSAKNKKSAILPMNKTVRGVLSAWYAQRDENNPLVFPSPQTHEKMRCIEAPFARLLNEAHITHFRFHDLRHDFASQLVMKGVDLNTVRELLTHADIKQTLRYAHLAPNAKAKAVKKLDKTNEEQTPGEQMKRANF